MSGSFGNIRIGASFRMTRRNASALAIAAWGVISGGGPVTPPGPETPIPLQAPLVVSNRQQYAAVFRFGDTEGAGSYDMRWSWDQVNWTLVENVGEVHEMTLPTSTAKGRRIYAQHRAVVGGVPQEWTKSTPMEVGDLSDVQIIVHPKSKKWQLGERLSDYTTPEGLTIAQMLDVSNFTTTNGATITKTELIWDANVGDIKSLTQRFDALDHVDYLIRVTYTTAAGATKTIGFQPVVRMVIPEVWLDTRDAEGTDKINIPASVPGTMVLPDFKHTINGTTYTTSGVTVAALRAGPVAVNGAAGVTIANVGGDVWVTVGVAAGAEMLTAMGRQFVWVPTYGSNPGPRAKINMLRGAQQVAGEGISLSVNIWGFDTRRNWREVWDDPMHTLGFKWVVPGRNRTTPVTMRPAWRDGTKAYGPSPKFVVRDPGAFSVSVEVSERSSGKYATASANSTTADPNVAFPGAATICITGGGSTAGAPAGATMVADWAAAVTAWKANRSTKKRILFSSHVEHDLNGSAMITSGFPNCYIDSYGGGRAVVYRASAQNQCFYLFAVYLDQDGAIIRNISMRDRAPWNPTTETGTIGKTAITVEAGGWVTILDTDAEGFEASYGTRAHNLAGALILAENASRGHRDYALYCATNTKCHVGILGNLFQQKTDAMQGGLGKGNTDPANKHFVRFQQYASMYLDGNDFFTRGGWTPPIGGMPIDQAVRDHSNTPLGFSYTCRNVFEGGWGMLGGGSASPDQIGAGGFDHPMNRVVENNAFIPSARTADVVSMGGCVTLRGNLIIKPRVKSSPHSDTAINFKGAIGAGGAGAVRGDYHIEAVKERMYAHHNTLVHLGDPTTEPGLTLAIVDKFIAVDQPYVRAGLSDNVIHMPNFPALGKDAGLIAVDEGVVPRFPGYKWRYEKLPEFPALLTMRTEFATPADTIRLWRAPAGLVATGDRLPVFDFDGNFAPGMPDGVGTTVPGTVWSGAVGQAA